MMRLEDVLRQLGEEQALEAVKIEWEDSQKAYPAEGIDFLQPEQVRANMRYGGFGEQAVEHAVRAAAQIQSNPALSALAWHCAWRTYVSNDEHWFGGWPDLKKALGNEAGMLYLLVGIAKVPRVRAFHKQMGIPEAVTRETCLEPYTYTLNYAEMSGGALGLPVNPLFWLRHYTREKYFRLGRYEFWLKRMYMNIRAFRSRKTGEVVALAPDGARFDAQGYRPGDQEPDPPGVWHSHLVEDPGWVRGNPIHPRGYALQEERALERGEWEEALKPGDWVLDMHIPAGGGMSPEAVHDSFRRAAEFFPRHFPDTPPKAYVCWSWIYNPNLDEILPAGSNLVRNLSDAYLVPVESDAKDGLGFMFYQDKFDPATAPRKTSLQRAILDFIQRGGRWRVGGMFYLLEDLDRLGSSVYQANTSL